MTSCVMVQKYLFQNPHINIIKYFTQDKPQSTTLK
jgi:hypothetical protein